MRIRLTGALMLSAALMILNSCKDDPAPPAAVSFDIIEQATTESNGALTSFHPSLQSGGVGQDIKVKIALDKALADNAVLSYSVGGTASKTSTYVASTGAGDVNDYNIDGTQAKDTQSLIIEKGATEAYITITVFEDWNFEVDDTDSDGNFIENIILTLESVVSGPIKLGTDKLTYTLTIKEDDDVFFLYWPKAVDADLDFFVLKDASFMNGSQDKNTDGYVTSDGQYRTEALFLPAGYPDGTYSLSYPFHSGTATSVDFDVYMLTTSGTLNGQSYPYSGNSALKFSGTYTQQNLNPYTDNATASSFSIEQTMVKSGINYASISNISVHTDGSRIKSLDAKSFSLNGIQINKFQKTIKVRK
jgi:hypothetical protein